MMYFLSSDGSVMSRNDSLHSISQSGITASSVIIKWNHMKNRPPSHLHGYYSYYVQYMQTVDSEWTTGRIVQYNPDDDPPQATLDELTPNTKHKVRILGIWVAFH